VAGAQRIIGIDLGTTNSALAFTRDAESGAKLLPIPQLSGPGEVGDESLLPSFLYLPGETEFTEGSLALPWDAEPRYIAGRFAQRRGGENAGRLVASAKSWLSNPGADRTAANLPWQAPEGVAKVSAIDASAEYLKHLRSAWNAAHPDEPFEEQDVLVTVPASFDEFARELTLQAARQAGFGGVTLLEEPQAAFYAWLDAHPQWRELVTAGDLILVIDIGGGTTDFSLIAVENREGDLGLERIAVGEHILLGGDNIDLALAHVVAARLSEKGTRIDSFQLQSLWNNCRAGKEKLLEPGSAMDEYPVTVLGKGSRLIGGAIKAELRRSDIEQVMDGFFPLAAPTDMPQKRRGGLLELGLPYAADAAVTRHLARFLTHAVPGGFARPTHVLFNGGVLHAPFVRERLTHVLHQWLGTPVTTLSGEDLMHAVARGAAYYGAARKGKGVRIRGGVSRSYYVGVESAMPAVPGLPAPLKALTVAQFGMEEGTAVRIPGRPFGLVVGEPAEFRFFSSATRKTDHPGDVIEDLAGDLEEMPGMQVSFSDESGGVVPVSFETAITELGQLQLWCAASDGRRWKLEFNVREQVPVNA
jgi:molecular chaperone DnaK (HSP70)